jgi:hypothetical protein
MREIDWAGVLVAEDVEALWNGLFHLVSRHPAVRPLHFATDGAAVMSQAEINADLTQELFLELFQKQRFEHYIDNNYTSGEIENELARIELPNLVGARLRKRYPESFRLARRVSALLKSSSRFKRFCGGSEPSRASSAKRDRPSKRAAGLAGDGALQVDYIDDDIGNLPDDDQAGGKKNGKGEGPRRQRMVNQIFGLKEWPRAKPFRDSGHFTELTKSVAMARRDTRLVGRSGTSQLILSNPDLEKLIVEVLKAIDSPADVRTLRQLVLSKIPLQDYNVSSLDQEMTADENGSAIRREARDTRDTPEDALLRGEQDQRVVSMADEFLSSLRHAVNNNDRRYVRLLSTLWHCYYNPQEPSQLEIARLLGVSDSLVSDNRRLIEYELKKLRLSVEEGAVFSEALKRRVVQDQSPSPR